jgi:uroporphyrinogen decarboxylase
MKTEKPILNVLSGEEEKRVPVWLMRQAGRYLPEYRSLRAKSKNFLNMCLTPEWAAEITLQPIRRFDFDAAILFADILLIPHALGQKLEFREGEGPVLEALQDEKSISALNFNAEKLTPVMETLDTVKGKLPSHTALIGFCGGLWTVAAYMIDGTSKQGFVNALKWAQEKPERLEKLISVLLDASEKYLSNQIKAGAEVIQLFESWAGLLSGPAFDRFVVEPTRELVSRLKRAHPTVPVIGFPREAGGGYRDYVTKTGIDALSIDQNVKLDYARQQLKAIKPLQGNLDPLLLAAGGDAMKAGIENILATLGPKHIFNLGHGVIPQTPPENVSLLVETIRAYKAN